MFLNNKNKIVRRHTLVLSSNSERLNLIREHLNVRGLEVRAVQKKLDELGPNELLNLESFVIELGDIKDYSASIETIRKILPKDVICVVLADNDSIKVRQEFISYGLRYLHYESQFKDLYHELSSQAYSNANSTSVNISVLGTKGGVGSSFVSYHLSKIIFNRYKTRVLLVQGAFSSFNIDLFGDRTFSLEDYRDVDVSFYRESDFEAYGFMKFANDRFNFIVYDYSIQSLDRDRIEHILSTTDCALLLINSDLSSVRKAKEVLEINDFLSSVNQGAKKKILALNDISLHKTLSKTDIRELLGIDVDVTIPFGKSTPEVKSMARGSVLKGLQDLASIVIGKQSQKSRFKFLRA